MNINLNELAKAFTLAHKFADSPLTPVVQREQFLAIALHIWNACDRQEPKESK